MDNTPSVGLPYFCIVKQINKNIATKSPMLPLSS